MNKQGWAQEFRDRFERHEEELRWLYMELYHGDEQAWDYFADMLRRAYESRREDLRELDRQRLRDPDWYKGGNLVGMLMYVDCFAGTLNGVREKLDYIEDCGVNYLHLMPLLESPVGRSDGGYAVSDFRKVQPSLGTMEDLAALAADCHGRGVAVCLDFVMNHTSEDHEWARRARAGQKEYQDRYFFYDDWSVPREFEKTVPQVFPTTAPGNFSWCPEASKVVMTTFYPYQWDLNYANPAVFNDMTENMLFLCNQGVDIIRLDAVPYIWKQLGTSCRNLPQVHSLVRMMRMVCEIVCPSCLLLGEVVMEPSKVVPYFGTVEKPECHLLYNVTTMATTWHTVATRDVSLLKKQLDIVTGLPKSDVFLNYLRCHDDIGWGLDYQTLRESGQEEVPHKKYLNDFFRGLAGGSRSRGELYNDDPVTMDARFCGTTASMCGIEKAGFEQNAADMDLSIRQDLMLHACMFMQSGIPVIYSGDEVGQVNDYSYKDDPEKAADSRYLHRGPMKWDLAELRKDPESVEGRIFDGLSRLEMIRREEKAFMTSADMWTIETYNRSVLCIGRYFEGEKIIGVFNFSENDQMAWISETDGVYHDLLSGNAVKAAELPLEPYGFYWLKRD